MRSECTFIQWLRCFFDRSFYICIAHHFSFKNNAPANLSWHNTPPKIQAVLKAPTKIKTPHTLVYFPLDKENTPPGVKKGYSHISSITPFPKTKTSQECDVEFIVTCLKTFYHEHFLPPKERALYLFSSHNPKLFQSF